MNNDWKSAMQRKFIIIGMDDNRTPFFPPEVLEHIRQGKVFSGGVRHKEIVGGLLPDDAIWISITVPLDNVFAQYERVFAQDEKVLMRYEKVLVQDERVFTRDERVLVQNEGVSTRDEKVLIQNECVSTQHEKAPAVSGTVRNGTEDNNPAGQIIVFASGDPLFFGFANTVRRKLPDAAITLYPSFNSLQVLAHRLVMPYDDMRTVSLTGRPWHEFDRALIERTPKIGILTDREHTPAAIAARMLEYGYRHYTMYVGEHLGNPGKERIRRMTLEEAVLGTFEHPNNLLLCACSPGEASGQACHECVYSPLPARPFGIPDELFAHLDGRARMITKAPIRLLTLQALELNRRRVFWDVGFCTGSVSIEARLQLPHLTVVSFEIRAEGEELMNINSRRFGAPGITAIIGDFLQAETGTLPRPDAVFIGGHGGHLLEMLMKIKEVLLPGGCIVFNSVSAESRQAFAEGAEAAGMELQPSVRIALNDYNPIEIMKAVSPEMKVVSS